MNVTDTFFEKAITFFTNLVYTQIRYAVASGDVAPFVGHNAILRWDALQAIEYICPHDNRPKWWSEETVSEDFDMALRLQGAGYLVRLAGYKMNGQTYNEGVSLTVYDELMRWEKYAFGCSELLFHPLKYWFTRGPFTKLFRDFMKSPIPLCSKFTIMVRREATPPSSMPLTVLTGLHRYLLRHWFLMASQSCQLLHRRKHCSLNQINTSVHTD